MLIYINIYIDYQSTSLYSIVGLPKYTELEVSVAAKTSVGLGPASSPVNIRTREDGKVFKILFDN